MIFGYTLGEAQKFVVAFIFFAATLAGFFIAFDPATTPALVAVSGAIFALAGVFLNKQHTVDDMSKALSQLQGTLISLVGIYVTVDPALITKIGMAVAAVIGVYAVYKRENDPVENVPVAARINTPLKSFTP